MRGSETSYAKTLTGRGINTHELAGISGQAGRQVAAPEILALLTYTFLPWTAE